MKNDLSAEQLQQLVTVTLPLGVVLRITTNGPAPAAVTNIALARLADLVGLPPIGDRSLEHAGIFAGVTVHENVPMGLFVLDGDEGDKNWNDAQAWAKEKGGTLPSRIDALVLFQNLREHFKEAAYWTDAPYAGDESYAWYQYFFNGSQNHDHKSSTLRARAVRRIAI